MHNSICFFSSFFNSEVLPYYVKYYLSELCQHFTDVVFITNSKDLNGETLTFFASQNVRLLLVKNEGYDFGMWHKAFQQVDVSTYRRVALINDSCILFRPLADTFALSEKSDATYVGILQSNRYAPHIQSFFVIIKDQTIGLVLEYFQKTGLVEDYRQVIQKYEIGLCTHLRKRGVNIAGLYGEGFENHPTNPSFTLTSQLIAEGMPLIKKKMVFRNYRGLEYYWLVSIGCDSDYRRHIAEIYAKYGKSAVIDFKKVLEDAPKQHHRDIFALKIGVVVSRFSRNVPFLPHVFNATKNRLKKLLRN